MMYKTTRKQLPHRVRAFVLALCMALTMLPAPGGAANAAAADEAMDKLLNWGVVGGYPDGGPHPERSLTRAEFVAMVNRAYGYKETGDTPFIDVPAGAWFHDDIGIAYNAKYFGGVSPRMAAPDSPLTREMAMVLLARNMRLDPVAGEVIEFADGRDFADWSRGYARAAAQAGLIGGYGDGTYKPGNDINRGEMATMLQRALGTLVNRPGVHTLSDVYGNVTISSPNATLRDTTIAGDLYITGGLDLGDITLENVRVLGDIIVAGGGESQSGNDSIILRNVEADSLMVDSIADQYVSLATEGNTVISDTVLRSDAFIQDRTRPGRGLLNISLESPDENAAFTLSGNLETVVNKTPNSTLNVAMGTVDSLTIDEKARGSTLNLDVNSTAATLNLDVATTVSGVGDVDRLYVNAAGSAIEMLPDTITIRPGLTADIAGESMNAVQAQESSSDPRLLAGYPKIRNIAPASATAVYSTNKAGTVYWALSTTTDGSIGEDELVMPTEGNTRILLNGNTPSPAANEEVTAALANLTPDSNYYLSTVMVDARSRRSPVKVAAFATPDNTVPAFTADYPRMVNIWSSPKVNADGSYELKDGDKIPVFYAQAGAMTNKTCQLYYALYPAGSAQPTGQQFRTGSLGRPIYSGVEDVTKNVVWTKDFENLEELTSYDLYLWLTDADGAQSSAVQKLTFTTVDGTAPKFEYDTPELSGNPLATTVPTRVNVNENATVYWAAIRHGADYLGIVGNDDAEKAEIAAFSTSQTPLQALLGWLKDKANGDAARQREQEALDRKVESGASSVSNGSSAVRGGADLVLNITGLAAETAYDVYFVAKDAAGNYSDLHVLEDIHTLDTTPPTVRQEFSRTDVNGNPYANTDIELIFSEDIQVYTQNANDPLRGVSLSSLIDAADTDTLDSMLSRIIFLYNDSGDNPNAPVMSTDTIDFSKATIQRDIDSREVTVVLSSDKGAINLKSGATYHFEFDNIQDLATTPNRMQNMPVSLDPFRTITAQVTLRALNVPTIPGPNDASGNPTTIPIDMAFSLTPVSTNVESDVDWDILFWSDSSVTFEVYELEGAENSVDFTGDAVRTASGVSEQKIVNNAGAGYYALSLFRNFYGLSFNPSVTGEGNRLTDAQEAVTAVKNSGQLSVRSASGGAAAAQSPVKYYGIRFTEVNNAGSERAAWDATVNFRVSVVTGSSSSLGNLASNITENTLDDYVSNWGVAEIHSPAPFPMRKQFSNSLAPSFYNGYPQFRDVTDTEATLRVMLDRAGTLYYAVAPVSVGSKTVGGASYATYDPSVGTTLIASWNSGGETVTKNIQINPDLTTDVINGTAMTAETIVNTYIPGSGGTGAPLFAPAPSAIYSPNFGSDDIKSGSRRLGTSYIDIPLEDLNPNTLYFAYFVMQGTGQVYSDEVLVYQFRTETVNRPKLYIVNSGASTVNVRSRNMNAVADYAIFLGTTPPDELGEAFSKAVDPAYASQVDATYLADDYTVYMAMSNQDSSGGSLYDQYASADHKDAVRKLITGQTYSGSRIDNSANVQLRRDVADSVNCATQYGISPGQQYLFVASARSNTADESVSANSYGFSAYQPVYIVDDDPPIVSNVSGNVTVDANYAPARITGRIYLTFDKDLYYYASATERRLFTDDGASSGTEPIARFQYLDGTRPMDSGVVAPTGITGSRTVALRVGDWDDETNAVIKYAVTDNNFLATPGLVSYYSSPNYTNPLEFTLRYDEASRRVYVDFKSTDWFAAGSAVLNTTVESDTTPTTDIRLDHDAIILYVGEEDGTVTATALPRTASDRTVFWSITDTSIARITSTAATTETVNGETVTSGGTATIQAVREGTTELVATTADGVTKTCTVTVSGRPVNNITLTHTDGGGNPVTLATSETVGLSVPFPATGLYTVSATLTPENASVLTSTTTTLSAITVTSSNPNVIRLDGNPVRLTRQTSSGFEPTNVYTFNLARTSATASGSATITVASRDGSAQALFTIYTE